MAFDITKLFRLNRRRKAEDNIGKAQLDPESEISLIVYTDKRLDNLADYFENKGLNVSQIHSDLIEAYSEFLGASGRVRLVVIDTGTGILSSSRLQEILNDCMVITDGRDKFFSVFLTKKTFFDRNYMVDYHPFRSMEDTLKKVIAYEENYGELQRTVRKYEAEHDWKFMGDKPPKVKLRGVAKEKMDDYNRLNDDYSDLYFPLVTLSETTPEGCLELPGFNIEI